MGVDIDPEGRSSHFSFGCSELTYFKAVHQPDVCWPPPVQLQIEFPSVLISGRRGKGIADEITRLTLCSF